MKLDLASKHVAEFSNEVIHEITIMNGQLVAIWNALDMLKGSRTKLQDELHEELQVALDSV